MRLSQPNGRAHRAHGKDRTRRTAAQRAAEDVVMTPNWTSERPTKPGEYWLSLPPKQRTNQQSAIPVVCYPSSGILGVYYDGITGEWLNAVMSSALDGALWSVRETPADPFEVTG